MTLGRFTIKRDTFYLDIPSWEIHWQTNFCCRQYHGPLWACLRHMIKDIWEAHNGR